VAGVVSVMFWFRALWWLQWTQQTTAAYPTSRNIYFTAMIKKTVHRKKEYQNKHHFKNIFK
jgi:hypothetical protein